MPTTPVRFTDNWPGPFRLQLHPGIVAHQAEAARSALQLLGYNSLWLGVKNAFPARWEFEINLTKAAAEGAKTKEKLSDEKRLFHSGTISTLGSEIDAQLCSVPYRKKRMRNHGCIQEIVSSDILGNLPKTFSDKIQVDNTQKGRASLSVKLRKAMV